MHFRTEFVLASRSPRRKAILHQMGLQFAVVPGCADESTPDELAPGELVRTLALRKARSVAEGRPHALVLGADTVVSLGGRIYGKPAGAEEAASMLESLSGKTHTVYTGMALVHAATRRSEVAVESTDVTFAVLSRPMIDRYVSSGAPLDKAGAYGIQDDFGCVFVRRISGDYFTVVGLPASRLYRMLTREFGDLCR